MRTLFLQAPSFDGYDGGAGARYQMKREVRSFWYPTWLAQPAALVEGSKLIDAPPHDLSFKDIEGDIRGKDLIILHTSSPSFKSDVKTAEMIKEINASAKIGFIGAKVAVEPEKAFTSTTAIDFVARNEFDFTIKEIADGRDWANVKGISYRNTEGVVVHNVDREILHNMDDLPFVTPVYKRDLDITKYFGGYLKHPYVSFYTGRGCKSRCTFCLWPQTVGGHNYRVRSIEHVIEEVKYVKEALPQAKEIFFDDDTLTDNLPRVEALAKELGKLGVVWSCNAKANVPRKTLEVLKDNGLRLLLVGYESGNQKILHNIKKGLLHILHFFDDVLDRADAIVVAANGLRPEAEGAARFAAPARIERNVRVFQIAAEIFGDVEIALVDRRHERQIVHIVQDFAIDIMDDDAFGVAIGDAFHVRPVASVGDLFDGEIKLVARDEVDGRCRDERFLRFHGNLGADETDFRARINFLDHLGRLHVRLERRRRCVQHDQVFAANVAFEVLEGEIMRRRVDQL